MVEEFDIINVNILKFIEKAKKKYRITRAYLYGSFSKGTATKWSDIDLAIVSPDFSDDTIEDRISLMRISSSIDARIEPHPFSINRFNVTDPLVYEICQNGIRII